METTSPERKPTKTKEKENDNKKNTVFHCAKNENTPHNPARATIHTLLIATETKTTESDDGRDEDSTHFATQQAFWLHCDRPE